MATLKEEVEELRKTIRWHEYHYYVLSAPRISDHDFDVLMLELSVAEAAHPEFITAESPTQRVGGVLSGAFEKRTHPYRLLSLENAMEQDDLHQFDYTARKELERADVGYYCEPKLDGLTVHLCYDGGKLDHAVTRGTGDEGEDITHTVRTVKRIPLVIPHQGRVYIRGEAMILKAEFERINAELARTGDRELFANARNAASGTLRQKDATVTAGRRLSFYAYRPYGNDLETIKTEADTLRWLHAQGFEVPPGSQFCRTVAEVWAYIQDFGPKRATFPYEVDGVVVNLFTLNDHALMGFRTKTPKWAVAWKYKAEEATTRLNGVIWQVGRLGQITPVAVLEPVRIAGTKVSSASMHNIAQITQRGICIGDDVVVEKAGEIIPQVLRRADRPSGSPSGPAITEPTDCPVCHGPVGRDKEDAAALMCMSDECPAKLLGSLKHLVCLEAFDMRGVGPELLQALITAGHVKRQADLFDVTVEQLQALPRMAERSAAKAHKAIQDKRTMTLNRAIYALGIPMIGETYSRALAQHFWTWDAFALAVGSAEALRGAEGIGAVAAAEIVAHFATNQKEVQALIDNITVTAIPKPSGAQTLAGLKFVITGTLSADRAAFEAAIRNAGGACVGSVSSKTSYVVVGESPGKNKTEGAAKHGIKCISEAELVAMLEPKEA